MRDRLLISASIVLSATYLLTAGVPFPGRFLVKAGCIVLLGVAALTRGHNGLSLGLLLSSAGDALLEIDSKLFTAGLLAFLCAHLVYTITFVRSRDRTAPAPWAAISAVGVFAAAFGVWLLPSTGALAIPVICYIAAITLMVSSSIAARFPTHRVAAGALLFFISDAILATNRFKTELPARDFLVWSTYYAGQLLITLGFARAKSVLPRRVAAMAAAVLLLAIPARSQTNEILAVIQKSADDWNSGRIEAYMECYEKSAETTFVGKEISHGTAAVLERYRREYPTPERMGHVTFSELAARPLSPTIAIVTGRYTLRRNPENGGGKTGLFSLVLRKSAAGWRIILDHSN
jgi:uncharacterized membrane protein YhhN/ketosteroid isomerase-like protein